MEVGQFVFNDDDFKVFADPTLTGRLAKIRTQIDPKFEQAGKQMRGLLQRAGLPPQTLHIAKHARRHKNPPPNTWLALAASTRGYKMMPHIELGMWDDRFFLWVALLAESKTKRIIDPAIVRNEVLGLHGDFELCGDHTQKLVAPHNAANFDLLTSRYQATKAGEFLVGRSYLRGSHWYDAPDHMWADMLERLGMLAPIYKTLLAAWQQADQSQG